MPAMMSQRLGGDVAKKDQRKASIMMAIGFNVTRKLNLRRHRTRRIPHRCQQHHKLQHIGNRKSDVSKPNRDCGEPQPYAKPHKTIQIMMRGANMMLVEGT